MRKALFLLALAQNTALADTPVAQFPNESSMSRHFVMLRNGREWPVDLKPLFETTKEKKEPLPAEEKPEKGE